MRLFERGILHVVHVLLMPVILAAVIGLWCLFASALRAYFTHHWVRPGLVIVVALVAVSRHLINMSVSPYSEFDCRSSFVTPSSMVAPPS